MTAALRVGDLVGAMEPAEIFASEFDDDRAELRAVNAWRTEQLEQLGFSRTLAEACAGLVDWHEIADLVRQGCTLHLALEIVR